MSNNSYTGYIKLTKNEAASFYSNEYNTEELKENQYLIVDKDTIYCKQDGELRRVQYPIISNKWNGKIKPKEQYQEIAIDILKDKTSKVKLIRGIYGSGKDHLMINTALELIEKGKFNKIVFIRPNVTLANVPQIGYLPNGVEEKLAWTLAPLYDKLGGQEGVENLTEEGKLEMVPLLFIRGRSFENSIIYVTEAQNIDSEIAKVLLSRIGNNSELWLNGDSHQSDMRVFDTDNGLTKMVERLAGNKLFSYVYLPITHRSDAANLANLLDDE